jgi:hypothetical protein
MSGNSHAIIADDGKTETILQFCSKNYQVVLNEDLVKQTTEALTEANIDFELSERVWKKGRFRFDFVLKGAKPINIGQKDPIVPRLILNNSYDGGLRYSFDLGYYRFICSNGLMVPMEGTKTFKKKKMHTLSLGTPIQSGELKDSIKEFEADSKEITKEFKELQDQHFKVEHIEERVQEVIENTSFPSRQAENVIARLYQEIELLQVKEPNNWLLYNAFNFNLQHNSAVNLPFHKEDKIDRQVLDFIRINL